MDRTTWQSRYRTIVELASAARGISPTCDAPNTTGRDVIAIASLVAPAAQTLAATTPAAHAWQLELARLPVAVARPTRVYKCNATFWPTVYCVALALDRAAVPLPPPALWHALANTLASGSTRNADIPPVPFGPFATGTDGTDLYLAMLHYLQAQRGADPQDPPKGWGGVRFPIPRATNADVIAVAPYWTARLDATKEILGDKTIKQDWTAATADVDKIAKVGRPTEVYSKNNEFWRVLGRLASHVAAADAAPTHWDIAKDVIHDAIQNAPERAKNAAEGVGDFFKHVWDGVTGAFKWPLIVAGSAVGLYVVSRVVGGGEAAPRNAQLSLSPGSRLT